MGCDLNFVRGEDSSRARTVELAAPVWQIYPQCRRRAHEAKLAEFLRRYCHRPAMHAARFGGALVGTASTRAGRRALDLRRSLAYVCRQPSALRLHAEGHWKLAESRDLPANWLNFLESLEKTSYNFWLCGFPARPLFARVSRSRFLAPGRGLPDRSHEKSLRNSARWQRRHIGNDAMVVLKAE